MSYTRRQINFCGKETRDIHVHRQSYKAMATGFQSLHHARNLKDEKRLDKARAREQKTGLAEVGTQEASGKHREVVL